jgi:hypothetical protein
MKAKERQYQLEQIISRLEKSIEEAKQSSEQHETEPRFRLAHQVGYLQGAIKSAVIELRYIE